MQDNRAFSLYPVDWSNFSSLANLQTTGFNLSDDTSLDYTVSKRGFADFIIAADVFYADHLIESVVFALYSLSSARYFALENLDQLDSNLGFAPIVVTFQYRSTISLAKIRHTLYLRGGSITVLWSSDSLETHEGVYLNANASSKWYSVIDQFKQISASRVSSVCDRTFSSNHPLDGEPNDIEPSTKKPRITLSSKALSSFNLYSSSSSEDEDDDTDGDESLTDPIHNYSSNISKNPTQKASVSDIIVSDAIESCPET